MIRNADRCVFFKPPAHKSDLENALTDAVVSLEPGKMLVYRMEPIKERTLPDPLFAAASVVAGRLGCAIVQWPNGGRDDAGRSWCWAIQKPTAN